VLSPRTDLSRLRRIGSAPALPWSPMAGGRARSRPWAAGSPGARAGVQTRRRSRVGSRWGPCPSRRGPRPSGRRPGRATPMWDGPACRSGGGTATRRCRPLEGGGGLGTVSVMASKARAASGELRARRAAAGLTQQKLAERASVSIASVALYEGGYSPAHSTVLGRLFAVLDDLNDERPASRPGAVPTSAEQGRDDPA